MKDGFCEDGHLSGIFPFHKKNAIIMQMHLAYAVLYTRTHACAQAEDYWKTFESFATSFLCKADIQSFFQQAKVKSGDKEKSFDGVPIFQVMSQQLFHEINLFALSCNVPAYCDLRNVRTLFNNYLITHQDVLFLYLSTILFYSFTWNQVLFLYYSI